MMANRPAPKEKAPTQPAEASQKEEGMLFPYQFNVDIHVNYLQACRDSIKVTPASAI